MAKIVPSALVDHFSGNMGGGSVMSRWKGIGTLKKHPSPRQPRSEAQQAVRGNLNTLAGDYYALSDTEKLLWEKYASLLPGKMSGLNAFIKLNSNLRRYLGVADQITAPPPTPSTPEALGGFAVTVTDSLNNSIAWTTPTSASDYVIVDYSFMAGRSDLAHPRWGYANGDSASGSPVVHTHDFPIGTVLTYRGRVMDSYGRISPNTVQVSVTVA
jgi:hypothetical protein